MFISQVGVDTSSEETTHQKKTHHKFLVQSPAGMLLVPLTRPPPPTHTHMELVMSGVHLRDQKKQNNETTERLRNFGGATKYKLN